MIVETLLTLEEFGFDVQCIWKEIAEKMLASGNNIIERESISVSYNYTRFHMGRIF